MNPFVVGAGVLLVVTAIPYLVFAGVYLAVRPRGSPARKQAVEPTVSIVLPTYNEAGIVERKLEDICAQDYPMDKVQLVVVDASDDETREIVADYFAGRDRPELRVIEEEERRGLAVALNEAYSTASGDIVIKTDCDSLLAADAVREAVANLADPDVGAVTGRNVDVLGDSAVEAGYRGIQSRVQALESHLDSTLIFHGPCSAFENTSIVEIDADSIADDSELALKIRKDGRRVVFDPAVRYKEAAHSAFGKRRTQKDRRAMGLLRLLWRNRDMLGGYGKYGRVVLPFNWWFMFVSPWLLVGTVTFTTLAGFSVAGVLGIVVPIAILAFIFAGSRELLGPLQLAYALFDTQVSLFQAGLKLLRGRGSPIWEVDADLREVYK